MTDATLAERAKEAAAAPAPGKNALLGRFAGQFAKGTVPFEVVMPDGAVQRFGQGAPSFHVTLKNRGAARDRQPRRGRIGDAYVAGDIDIEGDMLRPSSCAAR